MESNTVQLKEPNKMDAKYWSKSGQFLHSSYNLDMIWYKEDWLKAVQKEQSNYPLFNGKELDTVQLLDLCKQGKSPIEALNDLSTLC